MSGRQDSDVGLCLVVTVGPKRLADGSNVVP